jgi:hypothetical protein
VNKYQPVEIEKVPDIKEDANQKTENVVPLIHSVV